MGEDNMEYHKQLGELYRKLRASQPADTSEASEETPISAGDRREASEETSSTASDRREALGCFLPVVLVGLASVVLGGQSGVAGGAALIVLGLFILCVAGIPLLTILFGDNDSRKGG